MLLAMLLAIQTASARETPPVLEFPTRGLDDSAAYEGYTARLYRDSRGNAIEISIDGKSGRVVHLWADALNESIGLTTTAAVAFSEGGATVGATGGRGGRRWLRYSLTLPGGRSVQIGQLLLGSMRIERDFGYAGRVRDPIDAPTFVVPEMAQFAQRMGPPYTERLTLSVRLSSDPRGWTLRASQPSLDGKNHLWLTVSGDARTARAALANGVLTIHTRGARPVAVSVEIATDGPALDPLTRNQIFATAFRRFADSAKSQRLEREIRGFELLSSKQKLMAGLPTYATYFGRDMLMTALLMEPVWSDTMAEFVMGAALAKLAPDGEVSHEEALGGQAIRENAAEFLRTGDTTLLRNLQATRENYWMVDDDFQLPVVAGRYFANARVPNTRKQAFVRRWARRCARISRTWRSKLLPMRATPRRQAWSASSATRTAGAIRGVGAIAGSAMPAAASHSTSMWCGCPPHFEPSARSTARCARSASRESTAPSPSRVRRKHGAVPPGISWSRSHRPTSNRACVPSSARCLKWSGRTGILSSRTHRSQRTRCAFLPYHSTAPASPFR